MAYKKKTLRKMLPTTRKMARLIGELDSVTRRLKNLLEDIARLEADSEALFKQKQYQEAQREDSGQE